ncbi:valine--tRNA ligase, partial [archaeon]|nr:valine--tRNA ligase [archaeon]
SYFKEFEKTKSIHISELPKYNKKLEDKKLEEAGDLFIKTISDVRKFKSEKQQSLKTEVKLILPKEYKTKLKGMLDDLKSTTKATEIKFEKIKEIKIEI